MRPVGMSILSWVPAVDSRKASCHSDSFLSLSLLYVWIQMFCKDGKMLLWNSVWSEGVRIGYNHTFGKGWGTSTSYNPDWESWLLLSLGSVKTCGPGLLSFREVRHHWKADRLGFTLVKDGVSQANQLDRPCRKPVQAADRVYLPSMHGSDSCWVSPVTLDTAIPKRNKVHAGVQDKNMVVCHDTVYHCTSCLTQGHVVN